ncbi:hypothetical protein QBC44DRAFT_354194 [Cladorrhinum sp. PSN332]|nr:hypothetical protein QBC44DRAFT_354194 [Cladorrhinum sp. PSN332]
MPVPFPDDLPINHTQSGVDPEKRKSEHLGPNAKRQRRSPRPDGKPQQALPHFNVTKNVTSSSGFAARDGRPFPKDIIGAHGKRAYVPSPSLAPSTNSTLRSHTNPPATRSQGHALSSPCDLQDNTSSEHSNTFSQTRTLLGTEVTPNVPTSGHTQEIAQTQNTLVDPIHIKHEDDESNFYVSALGYASWHKRADNTDYFEDDDTLRPEDWLNLPCDKAMKEETYSVGSSDEEDMMHLADAVASALKQTPPTSVLKDMDASSPIEVFDPSLQHSPPVPSNEHAATKSKQPNTEEELLDEDVDWDAIMLQLPAAPKYPSLSPQLPTQAVPIKTEPTSPPPSNLPKPFARPPFPAPLRDKSPITGLSHNTVLRTCFRVGHFIGEGNRCHRHKQDAIFELYARVKFSSRENNQRVQHFQLADMFKDQQPYPTGILNGWKTGSLLEKHSAAFLRISNNNGEAKLCRCICRLKREKKNELGWVVDVLSIEEANWDDVRVMRGFVCPE